MRRPTAADEAIDAYLRELRAWRIDFLTATLAILASCLKARGVAVTLASISKRLTPHAIAECEREVVVCALKLRLRSERLSNRELAGRARDAIARHRTKAYEQPPRWWPLWEGRVPDLASALRSLRAEDVTDLVRRVTCEAYRANGPAARREHDLPRAAAVLSVMAAGPQAKRLGRQLLASDYEAIAREIADAMYGEDRGRETR